MGCVYVSKPFAVSEDVEGQSQSSTEAFKSIGLSKRDVNMLFQTFNHMDADNSGTIRAIELFTYYNIELGELEKHLFAVFDEDQSGDLNFMEFVCSMWNLLTLPEYNLGILVYLMKDTSGIQRIKYSDVRHLIEIMHKTKIKSSVALRNMYKNLKSTCPTDISMTLFRDWTATNITVLSPLLILQLKLRKLVLGERYWQHMAAKRLRDPELDDIGYTLQLKSQIRRANADFKSKLFQNEMKRFQLRLRGPDNGGNVGRKLSLLMTVFNLNEPSSTRVFPIVNNQQYHTGSEVQTETYNWVPNATLQKKPLTTDNTRLLENNIGVTQSITMVTSKSDKHRIYTLNSAWDNMQHTNSRASGGSERIKIKPSPDHSTKSSKQQRHTVNGVVPTATAGTGILKPTTSLNSANISKKATGRGRDILVSSISNISQNTTSGDNSGDICDSSSAVNSNNNGNSSRPVSAGVSRKTTTFSTTVSTKNKQNSVSTKSSHKYSGNVM